MKVFVSIGSGPGIGYATAERFAKEGFQIVLTARNIERVEGLAAQLRGKGYRAEAHKLDAGDVAAVGGLIADVERRLGQIDVLHYNAASLRQATVADQPASTFVSDLAVNIGGALAATQAASPRMLARREGAIFFTGGFFGLTPNPGYASLSVGKAGVRNLALGLFGGHREQDVHVATLTVAAFVAPHSKESNDIAEEFWKLYAQPKGAWVAEVTYSG